VLKKSEYLIVNMFLRLQLFLLPCFFSAMLHAAEASAPYSPAKVVYDVSSPEPESLENILDRASFLQDIYENNSFEASIVIVVHEGAIPLFVHSENGKKKGFVPELMGRARSLILGEIIQFRVCQASARMQGYSKKDLPGFVTMVPMADAEIVKLQQNGYAYLR
jgi:intracellular sulfur oxidation DsrE/DsrF family protein